ncbi:sigma 54-interacting transcriptional regulator [Desulfobacula sp.]|uniref:sigma 54-interacting transcriptional regulator n=1 Tax=Desulfobacula sp. TaxID=2593537 RepID=UPI001ED4720E|nr:sigma-54-dependent Fis family transcriptional regulator [Desulfobacula sp.]
MKSILVCTTKSLKSDDIKNILLSEYKVDIAKSFEICFSEFNLNRYDFVFLELGLFNSNLILANLEQQFKKILNEFKQVFPAGKIIVMCPPEQLKNAMGIIKKGVSDYLTTPINTNELHFVLARVEESVRLKFELDYLRDECWQKDSLELIKTNSPRMTGIYEKIKTVVDKQTIILLEGETGVGKGVIARLIHCHSNRKKQPFIHVHCGAIPDTLLESELFGHEKGAFTGALKRKLGRFEIARGGTLFLDEISTISPMAQIKLLQILQDKTFFRVGGETVIESDVRIITASNTNLKEMCDKNAFRSDLYFRLSVFPLEIPSLKNRLEDIEIIIEYLIAKLNQMQGKKITSVHPSVYTVFRSYDWPGNIRELENIIERAFILESSSTLTARNLPSDLFASDFNNIGVKPDTSMTLSNMRKRAVQETECVYLKELLNGHCGRINQTAKSARISTRQLHKLLLKHKIAKEDYKPKNKLKPH